MLSEFLILVFLGDAKASTSAVTADEEVEMTQEIVNLKCPYTGLEMVNPVRNIHCNHNYERDGIQQYIKHRRAAKYVHSVLFYYLYTPT